MSSLVSLAQLGIPGPLGEQSDHAKAASPASDEDDSDSDVDEAQRLRKHNSALQELFTAEMQDLAEKRGHLRVAVLLIQWEVEDESYLDTRAEVKSLRAVLEHDYRFLVQEEYLHTRNNPAHQLNYHLAAFVRDHDDDKALLVFYYAGHALAAEGPVKGKRSLVLQGGNSRRRKKYLSRILWVELEHQLERATADLLVIFDCSYAGLLANDSNGTSPPKKIFEFLGATLHNKVARGPGPWSFTTALIWALKQLAQEPDGFTISQLTAGIKKAPNFREIEQEPTWSPRGRNPSLFTLTIAPLRNAPSEVQPFSHVNQSWDATPADDQKKAYLQLELAFSKAPTRFQIMALAKGLKDIVHLHEVPIEQARWKGLTDANLKMDFREAAATMVLKEIQQRRQKPGSISTLPAAGIYGIPASIEPPLASESLQIAMRAAVDNWILPLPINLEMPVGLEMDRAESPVGSSGRRSIELDRNDCSEIPD